MLKSAEKDLDIAIEKGDMMSVKVAREMISWANEKLRSAAKHWVHTLKLKLIGSKQK